jgi:hypothetical protein
MTDSLKEKETILRKKIAERRAHEEILWKQKSRIQWIKEGEKHQILPQIHVSVEAN